MIDYADVLTRISARRSGGEGLGHAALSRATRG